MSLEHLIKSVQAELVFGSLSSMFELLLEITNILFLRRDSFVNHSLGIHTRYYTSGLVHGQIK